MTDDQIEYRCCDCGYNVVAFGYVAVPDPPRCATCRWISELPPEDREAVRERLRPQDGKPHVVTMIRPDGN